MQPNSPDKRHVPAHAAGLTRKHYRKPALKHYGSVKNLTHSTGTLSGDGGSSMRV